MVSFVDFNESVAVFDYPCGDNHECHPIHLKLPVGFFQVEVYGAQGGSNSESYSRGGYSRGILHIIKPTEIFLRIGSKGKCNTTSSLNCPPSFNGGGSGMGYHSAQLACSGGGSTDIRVHQDDLYHRVIVAGGGGGSTIYGSHNIGGSGGGYHGINGSIGYSCDPGSGGTQIEGGKTYPAYDIAQGKFGYGGNATDWDGGGGGGGWYGGAAGQGCVQAGGGGSGFVFNESSYENAISSGLELDSSFFLNQAFTADGSQEFSGLNNNLITGNTGNGAVKIILLGTYFNFTCDNHPKLCIYSLFFHLIFFLQSS